MGTLTVETTTRDRTDVNSVCHSGVGQEDGVGPLPTRPGFSLRFRNPVLLWVWTLITFGSVFDGTSTPRPVVLDSTLGGTHGSRLTDRRAGLPLVSPTCATGSALLWVDKRDTGPPTKRLSPGYRAQTEDRSKTVGLVGSETVVLGWENKKDRRVPFGTDPPRRGPGSLPSASGQSW